MRTVVWVGRVKSTTAPALLEAAFGKVGTVSKVETGFAGFAFVEYENEDDADAACEQLNKQTIQHVGEIRVAKATMRGYEDAVNKRDSYWRSRGEEDGGKGGGRGGRSRSRTRSPRRQRAASNSRSRGRKRRRKSHRRSRSSARSRSYSQSRKSSQSIQRANQSDHEHAKEDLYPSPGRQNDRPPLEAPSRQLALAAVPAADEAGVAGLARGDRAKVVCFYDGAHACDLLIEGAGVMKVPDDFIPDMLNAFPHGFASISQEAAMRLLESLSTFIRNNTSKVEDEEQSVEVRQTLAVNKRGERVMRKALLVNGGVVCKEEQAV